MEILGCIYSRSGSGGACGDCGEEDSEEDHPRSGVQGRFFPGRRQDPEANQTDAYLVFAVRQGNTDSIEKNELQYLYSVV